MKINIVSKINTNLIDNEINITLECSETNQDIQKITDYINNYKDKIIVKDNNVLVKIPYEEIILFYSKGKENYCKTHENEYKIKSRLYELERLNKDYIRVSKKYVVNFEHVKCFDMTETGKIIIKLDNDDRVVVSRRRIRDVMDYLDERSI